MHAGPTAFRLGLHGMPAEAEALMVERDIRLVRETGDRQYKISLRSRGDVDVERIASRWGGGGHKNAAGARLEGSAADVRTAVVAGLEEALE